MTPTHQYAIALPIALLLALSAPWLLEHCAGDVPAAVQEGRR